MSTATLRDPLARPGEAGRWSKALALVLGVHAVPAVVAAYWLAPTSIVPVPEPAILIDLTPPAATPEPPSETPPGPKQVEAPRPQPQIDREIVELPEPVVSPQVAIPLPPPEPPTEPTRPITAPETTAPPVRPAPPALRTSSGQATWQSLLLGHLDRYKRYPRDARLARQQGTPWIRFVMDRDGRVVSVSLERSSGFRSLDAEAVGLPRRAQPLPTPPEDVPGQTIELVVPVEFFMR